MAPGLTDLTAAVRASYHLLLGHGLAVAGDPRGRPGRPDRHRQQPQPDRAGHRPRGGHRGGRGAPTATPTAGGWTRSTAAATPRTWSRCTASNCPSVAGDLETIAAPLDWLGLNYYFRQVVADDPTGPAPYARQVRRPGVRRTAMDWEVHADGLEQLLLRLTKEYGAAAHLRHRERLRLPRRRRAPTARSTTRSAPRTWRSTWRPAPARPAKGAPLAGYFAWSLLDNFEWAYGYDKRFGLVHVDYATQQRTVKGSGHRYAEIIREHRRGASKAA